MQRILIALLILGSASIVTVYANNSASITIQGTVLPSANIAIAPVSGYNSLNILGGVNNQVVAIVTEKSSAMNGYTVTLQSANAHASSCSQAILKGADANSGQVPYSITYDTQPVTLDATGSATITSAKTRSGTAGVQKSLYVTINPTWVESDTYSDTLVLTLKNNN